MHKPGEIVYCRPGFAIMALGNNKYIFGDKVLMLSDEFIETIVDLTYPTIFNLTVPAAAAVGFVCGMAASEGRQIFSSINKQEAIGFALAMASLTFEEYPQAWAILQKSHSACLFAVHPHVRDLAVASAESAADFAKESERTRVRLQQLI